MKKSTPVQEILAERKKTHGDFTDHARIAQEMKLFIHLEGKTFTHVQKESLDMIFHKIARIVAGDPDVADHWNDIAGYAKLVADRCSK